MNRNHIILAVIALIALTTISSKPELITEPSADDMHSADILVFTKTNGYRHQSIEKGVATLKSMGKRHHFKVSHSEDAAMFTSEDLYKFDLVVFLSTTEDIFDSEQQQGFKKYIQSGKSFMGIHAATDTEYDWPWYGKLVGAYFESHPNNPNVRDATLQVIDQKHQSTKHLDSEWKRKDEWYNYKNINPDIKVLINLDESSYEGGTNGENHPIAWYHKFEGSRVFYTGGGHTEESFDEPEFRRHLLGGINYCLKRK